MKKIYWLVAVLLIFPTIFTLNLGWLTSANAQSSECPPGFHWDRLSGVGCVQSNCLDIAFGKLTYTGSCSCQEGYKGCYEPVESSGIDCYPFCPISILVACVTPEAACPGNEGLPSDEIPNSFLDNSLSQPVVPEAFEPPTISTTDLADFLTIFLAGERTQSPSLGWGAVASLFSALLLGTWILINTLPSLTLEDIRSIFRRKEMHYSDSSPVSSTALPSTSRIKQIYDSNPANFRQCQDMVYGRLWNQPPPNAIGQDKADIFQKMVAEGYWQADQGGMYDPQGLASRLSQLQDGDIIMFSDYGLPNETGAHHYAIVADGKIVEILNLPKGGEMNITNLNEAQKFFTGRTYQSKVDHKIYKPRAYYGYKVFRK